MATTPGSMFDSIEIQPSRDNFGTMTKRTRPTVADLSMGNLKNHFEHRASGSNLKPNEAMLDDIELNENDAAIVKSHAAKKKPAEQKEKKKFGTFDGVLARCLLCIWGVIMYLRTGWIVGNAGVLQTTIIMLLASSVTFLTSLSLSAICTNGEVKSGGYYFLISRSLGPEFGGVIGLLFAFANCISVAMYLAGFSETIVAQYEPPITGSEKWDIVLWAELTLVCILLMALRGVSGIIKFDMVLLVVLIISIIVYFVGTFGVTPVDPDGTGFTGYSADTFADNWAADYMPGESFITVFSVFFPAVTGEMAGANISGDLKNPSYSIPNGTLSAIVISTVVYIGIALSLGGAVLRSVGNSKTAGLYYDNQIMPTISAWQPLVIVGIFASTLSSGMSCFVGAPRIFQAVCKDKLFPQLNYFAHGRERDGEPVRAYCIVFVICFCAILTGDINFIAPIITNFFLITYAVMNYSTFTWSLTRSPGWRPTFKWYNKWVSLFASAQCIVLMFLIDWAMALVTAVICLLMYKYVSYTEPDVHWGTAGEAITYVETCAKLLKYQTIKAHAKVERPKFLIFNRNTAHMQQLFQLCAIMNEKFSGTTMIGDIVLGSAKDHRVTNKYVKRARNHEWNIPTEIVKQCLIQTCIATSNADGVRTILQTAGVGAIRPNIVVFSMSQSDVVASVDGKEKEKENEKKASVVASPNSLKSKSLDNEMKAKSVDSSDDGVVVRNQSVDSEGVLGGFSAPDYIDGVQDALLTGMGVVLLADRDKIDWTVQRTGFIDVWWIYDDGGLTVLIPYLLKSHRLWRDCKLRIMAIENLGYSEQNELATLMTKLRIKAEIVAVRSTEASSDNYGAKIEVQTTQPPVIPPTALSASPKHTASPKSRSRSKNKDGYDKTLRDDEDADYPFVDDHKDDDQQAQRKKEPQTPQSPYDEVDVSQIDLENTLITGSKLMRSSFMEKQQKSLRHEVFTYDHIDDLNPDAEPVRMHPVKEEEEEHALDPMLCDPRLSNYAKKKLKKYQKLGELIVRSKDSELCIVTMPFPRAEYTSYEYMKILESLAPESMDNLMFVRGNQDQVLTFAL